jgi:hypothetical protein
VPLQVVCRGSNEVPDPESVNTFVFEVMKAFYAAYELLIHRSSSFRGHNPGLFSLSASPGAYFSHELFCGWYR